MFVMVLNADKDSHNPPNILSRMCKKHTILFQSLHNLVTDFFNRGKFFIFAINNAGETLSRQLKERDNYSEHYAINR